MYYEIALTVFLVIAGTYFFYLGENAGKELAASLDEHPVCTCELSTMTVISYVLSFLCFIAAILCILRTLN
tara:strand:+ start:38428 stop:38640 length:213 start_codon:yes stop_codon:yes gene_type:complete